MNNDEFLKNTDSLPVKNPHKWSAKVGALGSKKSEMISISKTSAAKASTTSIFVFPF